MKYNFKQVQISIVKFPLIWTHPYLAKCIPICYFIATLNFFSWLILVLSSICSHDMTIIKASILTALSAPEIHPNVELSFLIFSSQNIFVPLTYIHCFLWVWKLTRTAISCIIYIAPGISASGVLKCYKL